MLKALIVVLILALVGIGGYVAVTALTGKDCRVHFETRQATTFVPAPGVTVSVPGGPSGVTDSEGFLELKGVQCGRDLTVNLSGDHYKSITVTVPQQLIMESKNVCVSGKCPFIIIVERL